jgi:hypothetical protein
MKSGRGDDYAEYSKFFPKGLNNGNLHLLNIYYETGVDQRLFKSVLFH